MLDFSVATFESYACLASRTLGAYPALSKQNGSFIQV